MNGMATMAAPKPVMLFTSPAKNHAKKKKRESCMECGQAISLPNGCSRPTAGLPDGTVCERVSPIVAGVQHRPARPPGSP